MILFIQPEPTCWTSRSSWVCSVFFECLDAPRYHYTAFSHTNHTCTHTNSQQSKNSSQLIWQHSVGLISVITYSSISPWRWYVLQIFSRGYIMHGEWYFEGAYWFYLTFPFIAYSVTVFCHVSFYSVYFNPCALLLLRFSFILIVLGSVLCRLLLLFLCGLLHVVFSLYSIFTLGRLAVFSGHLLFILFPLLPASSANSFYYACYLSYLMLLI